MIRDIYGFSGASRPWNSTDARPSELVGGQFIGNYKYPNQKVIDCCLNCPKEECDGDLNHCRGYRRMYLGKTGILVR